MEISPISNIRDNQIENEGRTLQKVQMVTIIDADETLVKLDNNLTFLLNWTEGCVFIGQEVTIAPRQDSQSYPYLELRPSDYPEQQLKLYQRFGDFYQVIN